MRQTISANPLTPAAFAPFGDVLDATGDFRLINEGLCRRHHDRARLDFGAGRAGISVFRAEPRALPYDFDLVERHPEGSQAFLPMTEYPFLVIVAHDEGGRPGRPQAFLTAPGQGINLHRGTWHGVLAPLAAPGLFAVIDRIGDGPNLDEYRYAAPWRVTGQGTA
ncbi:MAG TPA: ureidoglycolate lyase [Albidovulum sp.]|uniref:ureidoglycolate lyase n=1 Tax=Albidovulum sp. TaxID=1872424 RepID=UPI002BF11E8E|nr:ureidoglycolate lyase [Albidovulum sp.]